MFIQCRRVTLFRGSVLCVDFNEKFILSGSVDKTVKVWDVKSGTCRHTFRSHDAAGITPADCNTLIHYSAVFEI